MKNLFLALLLVLCAGSAVYGQSVCQACRDSVLARVGRRRMPANTGYVDSPYSAVHLFTMPKELDRTVIGDMQIGSMVKVLDRHTPGWCYVSINGVKGWMFDYRIVPSLALVANKKLVPWERMLEFPDDALLQTNGDPQTALTPAALLRVKKTPAFRAAARRPRQ